MNTENDATNFMYSSAKSVDCYKTDNFKP